jgi:hypothetical protein
MISFNFCFAPRYLVIGSASPLCDSSVQTNMLVVKAACLFNTLGPHQQTHTYFLHELAFQVIQQSLEILKVESSADALTTNKQNHHEYIFCATVWSYVFSMMLLCAPAIQTSI